MELTHEQYERIADCLPVQRGNVRHDNLVLLNAILFGYGRMFTGQFLKTKPPPSSPLQFPLKRLTITPRIVCTMRHHYPRSRRTLVPAALRKADTLTLEITCTVHVITSLRYFSPLLLPPRCPSWPRPDRRRLASRSASMINSTRIITTGTTTKIAPGVNTSPKTTETLTNIQSPISGSNRNTGTGATPIPTIAIIKTDTSPVPRASRPQPRGRDAGASNQSGTPSAMQNSQLSPDSLVHCPGNLISDLPARRFFLASKRRLISLTNSGSFPGLVRPQPVRRVRPISTPLCTVIRGGIPVKTREPCSRR
jgi:hypothetical protein